MNTKTVAPASELTDDVDRALPRVSAERNATTKAELMQLAEAMMRASWATGDDNAWHPARAKLEAGITAVLAELEADEQLAQERAEKAEAEQDRLKALLSRCIVALQPTNYGQGQESFTPGLDSLPTVIEALRKDAEVVRTISIYRLRILPQDSGSWDIENTKMTNSSKGLWNVQGTTLTQALGLAMTKELSN